MSETPGMTRNPAPQERRTRTRTCVGCGVRDDARAKSGLVRVVARAGELEIDLSGRARGRGAYLHARPTCIDRAPRGLARALRVSPRAAGTMADLGTRLAVACNYRTAALLLRARRINAVRIGDPQPSGLVPAGRPEPLTIVAVDAGSVMSSPSVLRAVAGGRALAWGTRSDLGVLLGTSGVACCTVEHESIAAELVRTRAAADAASAATPEAMQRCRRPEAR